MSQAQNNFNRLIVELNLYESAAESKRESGDSTPFDPDADTDFVMAALFNYWYQERLSVLRLLTDLAPDYVPEPEYIEFADGSALVSDSFADSIL